MATGWQIDMAAKPGPKPIGGGTFGIDSAVLAMPPPDADDEDWARRCARRHAKNAADYALLCDVLGITP